MQPTSRLSSRAASLLLRRTLPGYTYSQHRPVLKARLQAALLTNRRSGGLVATRRSTRSTGASATGKFCFTTRLNGARVALLRGFLDEGASSMIDTVSLAEYSSPRPFAAEGIAVAELSNWLSETCDRTTGAPLAHRFRTPCNELIARYGDAYASGRYGFEVDPSKIVYRATALTSLRELIEGGLINTAVIVAYPHMEELAQWGLPPLTPTARFLAMHLSARGFKLGIHDLRELDLYRSIEAGGSLNYASMPSLHSSVYDSRKTETLRDVAGSVSIVFTTSVDSPATQRGSFAEALRSGRRLLTINEYIAAMEIIHPCRLDSLPRRAEWLAGLTRHLSVYAVGSSEGLRVRCTSPAGLETCRSYRVAF